MYGKTETEKRLNGWLTGRFVDGIAWGGECLEEAQVVIKMHSQMNKGKFKGWLQRYLFRTFFHLPNENPRPRETDHRQIVEILNIS